jgi:hypothetical protein
MKRPGAKSFIMVAAALLFAASANAQDCSESIKSGLQKFIRFDCDASLIDQAIADFQKAATDSSCAYEANWRLAELHLNFGTVQTVKAEKLESFRQGQESALKAIEINPNGPEGHYFYAVNLGSQIEIDGVMKNIFKIQKLFGEINTTLKLNPSYAPALVVKARMMADLPGIIGGSDKKAEEFFQKALACGPHCESAYVEYSTFLLHKHRLDEVDALLDKVDAPGFEHSNPATWKLIDKPAVAKLRDKLQQDRNKAESSGE